MTDGILIWRGDCFAPAGPDGVDPADRGLLLGDGVFETMRVCATKGVRRGAAHRDRLAAALAALDLPPLPDWGAAEAAARGLAAATGGEAAVRLTVTRGPGPRGIAPFAPQAPAILLSAAPLARPPVAIRLATSAIRRDPTSPSNRHKTLSRADAAAARRAAVAAGGDMALMLASDGALSGCDAANLFWITDGALRTPCTMCGALPGVTRAALLRLADAAGLRAEPGRFAPEALAEAEAAFVTNALWGAVAVASVDGEARAAAHPAVAALIAAEAAEF